MWVDGVKLITIASKSLIDIKQAIRWIVVKASPPVDIEWQRCKVRIVTGLLVDQNNFVPIAFKTKQLVGNVFLALKVNNICPLCTYTDFIDLDADKIVSEYRCR